VGSRGAQRGKKGPGRKSEKERGAFSLPGGSGQKKSFKRVVIEKKKKKKTRRENSAGEDGQ